MAPSGPSPRSRTSAARPGVMGPITGAAGGAAGATGSGAADTVWSWFPGCDWEGTSGTTRVGAEAPRWKARSTGCPGAAGVSAGGVVEGAGRGGGAAGGGAWPGASCRSPRAAPQEAQARAPGSL